MKKRTNKLYVLLSLSLLSLLLLVGCSASDSSQDVADDTATRQEDTGSHTSLEQGIELNSDGTGCYSQEISVGENVALASVNFQYDIEKNTITSVDKVQVKAVKGWQYVKLDAVIDAEHIYYDRKRDWNKMVERAMEADFSWGNSAIQYQNLYASLIGE